MKIACGLWGWGCVIAATLLAAGCSKKGDDGAAGSSSATPTAAATGIKGTVQGKPFEAKTALLMLDVNDAHDAKLLLRTDNVACAMSAFTTQPDGSTEVTVIAPPKQGLTPFGGDHAFANLISQHGPTSSSTDTSHGEIEWIKVPAAGAKGMVRVRVTRDPDTKLEGTMEASLCKP